METDLCLPKDLLDPPGYEIWLLQVRESGHATAQILTLLEEEGSPEAFLRCARIAIAADDHRLARRYALAACLSSRQEVAIYAQALLATVLVQEARADKGPSEREGATVTIPALLESLEKIRGLPDRTVLCLEAECVLRLALSFAYQQLGQFDSALPHISAALLIAKNLGLVLTERGAHIQMSLCLIALGRLDESVPLLKEQIRQPIATHFSLAESRRQLAEVLFTLGDTQSAVDLLADLDPSLTPNPWPRAFIQLYRLLSGTGGMEVPVIRNHPWAGLYSGLAEALQVLIGTMAVLSQTQNRASRDQAYRQVLEVMEPRDQVQDAWLTATGQWLRSLAQTKLGRLGLAAEVLRRVPPLQRQWLDVRLLLAGQQLELGLQAMDLAVPNLNICEQALRAVFEDARELPYASRSGLAQRLRFWHPNAAAYAAVMPNPIEELVEASESILRSGERNSAYGLVIPPILAVELTLRSLGLDHRRTFASAHLNKTQNLQRQSLFDTDAVIPIWRPVVSPAVLVYGLHKSSSSPEYRRAAQRVVKSFGLIPKNKTPYAYAEIEEIEKALIGLLQGHLEPAQFVKLLNEI